MFFGPKRPNRFGPCPRGSKGPPGGTASRAAVSRLLFHSDFCSDVPAKAQFRTFPATLLDGDHRARLHSAMVALRADTSAPALADPRRAVSEALDKFGASGRLHEATEADTRVALVDAILNACGWDCRNTRREVASGAGGYLDYELQGTLDPWLVVEAKRVGKTFDLSAFGKTTSVARRSLATLNSRGGHALREVLQQAATYCNDRAISLACVTNGYQWVFFRGLSSKARRWTEGGALVFDGADEIDARFDDFYSALSSAWSGSSFLPERLDHPDSNVPAAKIPRDFIGTKKRKATPNEVSVLRAVGEYLLEDIHGGDRASMLRRCYVRPGVDAQFERTLAGLLEESSTPLAGDEAVAAGAPEEFVREIERQDALSGIRQPVVVVGHVGAGKTTFLHRSLSSLRSEKAGFCAIIDLGGSGRGGVADGTAEQRQVASAVLEKLGTAAQTLIKSMPHLSEGDRSHANPVDGVTLRTILREELKQERELGKRVWQDDPAAWNRRELELLSELKAEPLKLLPAFIGQLRKRFKKTDGSRYPVLVVLDNLDQAHEEYQRCIFGFAEQLAKTTRAVVVVCLREDTFISGRKPRGFLSGSQLAFVFHVEPPPFDRLLRERVRYGQFAVSKGQLPAGIRQRPEAVSRVCNFLHDTLLAKSSESLDIVAGLAGRNMRDGLGIARSMLQGSASVHANARPNGSAAYFLECLLDSVGLDGLSSVCRVANCFSAQPGPAPLHALRARLLAYFSFAHDEETLRPFAEDSSRAIGRFAAWGYPAGVVKSTMRSLLAEGALRPYHTFAPECPTDLPSRICITASGHVHLTRLLSARAYRAAMGLTCRWYDNELADQFIQLSIASGGRPGPSVADIAESAAVDTFDAYLAKKTGDEDATLVSAFSTHSWVVEVLSRSKALLPKPAMRRPSSPPRGVMAPTRASARKSEKKPRSAQGSLFPAAPPERIVLPELRSLPRDASQFGTRWVPRILWGLEHARLSKRGPLSATEIAQVLVEHADLDVPPNNVARAFRDSKRKSAQEGLWTCSGKRYEITDAGSLLLKSILARLE